MHERETFGAGCFSRVPDIFRELSAKKVLLVTGNRSFAESGAEQKLESFRKEFKFSRIRVTSEYPELEFIKSSIEHCRKFSPDAVLAIGGGNVMDTAKSVNFLAVQDCTPEEILSGRKKATAAGLPLIAVPTTSGSGSEATHFAVIYSGDNKFSLADKSIMPEHSIIDPELTHSLSKYQTAVSGIDALCQSVESVWACGSNDESLPYSLKAIELISKSFLKCVNSPDADSRCDMSRAANLAGKAINISKTTAPHALSYSMTRLFEIPHGQAVCVTLGEFLEYNYNVEEHDCNDERGPLHVKTAIEKILEALGVDEVSEGRKHINEIIKTAGLKTKLSELGIDSEEKIGLVRSNINAERLANNPRKLNDEAVKKILTNVF